MNATRKLNTRMALLTALIAAFGLVTGCQKKGAGKAGQAEPGHDEKAGPGGDKKAGPAKDKKTGPAKDKKAGPARPAGELASQLWSAGGFKVPESVLYSAAGNFFYVSLMGIGIWYAMGDIGNPVAVVPPTQNAVR